MTTATEHLYVVTDDAILSGEPIIKGTRTPVRAIVEIWRMGTLAEEIILHLPHLTQAQVFDALSYYSDHTSEINRHIERNRIPDELIGKKLTASPSIALCNEPANAGGRLKPRAGLRARGRSKI